MKKLIVRYKQLPKGIKRLIIVGSIVIPTIIGCIAEGFDDSLWEMAIMLFPIYWFCVFMGLWIYDGFLDK